MRTVHSKVIAKEAAVSWLVAMTVSVPYRVTPSPTKGPRMPRDMGALRVPASLQITVFCAFIVVALVACQSSPSESFYRSLAEADKDGAITRGRLPGFLPESSTDIHEIHALSPSTEWCAFRFLPSDSEALRKRLDRAQTLPPPVKTVPSPGVSWWPDVLTGNLDEKKISDAGFNLYVLSEPETSVTTEVSLFAIDWSKGRGFFYSYNR
jgi:hypothetical protein